MLQKVAGSTVLVPVGEKSISCRGMLTLNEVGAFIFERLKEDVTAEELAKAVCGEYRVDFDTALKDVNAFVERLRQKDIIDG